MVFQWQLHRYNPPFCERHRRGYETEGCLRIEFKPHKNKRLPAASCTETSWIATIFLKSGRSYSRTADAFSATTSSSICRYSACFAHSMHVSVRAFPMPRPQWAFSMAMPKSARWRIFSLSSIGSMPAVPAILPSTNAAISMAFLLSLRLQKFCFLLDGERIFLRIGQEIVRFCMREIKSAEHFDGISFTRSAKKAFRAIL